MTDLIRCREQVKKLKKELANAKALAYSKEVSSDPKVTGSQGGKKRMKSLTAEQRAELARKAATARWAAKKDGK